MQSPAASLCISSLQLQLHSGREVQRVVPPPRPQIVSMRKEAAERVIFFRKDEACLGVQMEIL